MTSVHINDDLFWKYVAAHDGDREAATEKIQHVVAGFVDGGGLAEDDHGADPIVCMASGGHRWIPYTNVSDSIGHRRATERVFCPNCEIVRDIPFPDDLEADE